jgi:hypothetical protein
MTFHLISAQTTSSPTTRSAISLERAALYLPCPQSTDSGGCAPVRNVRRNLRNPTTPSTKPLKLPRGCGGQASVPHGVGVQREGLAPSLWCRSPYLPHPTKKQKFTTYHRLKSSLAFTDLVKLLLLNKLIHRRQ